MPQIIIDGQRVEAAAGSTIIEAAMEIEKTLPHFCWHPGLSVSGNCRMCLVNVGFPKKEQMVLLNLMNLAMLLLCGVLNCL